MVLDLAPFDDLADLLDLQQSEDNYPALKWIRAGVQSAFESHLGRELAREERTEEVELSVNGTVQVPLRAIPVREVSEVKVDGDEESEYTISGYGVRLTSPRSGVLVQVTYTGGFDDEDLPRVLRRAAVYQAAYEYQTHEFVGAENVTMEGGGDVSRPELSLLKHVRHQIQPYMHPLRRIRI